MNRNYIIAFGATILVLAVLAFAAWVLFETEPQTKWVPPAREARQNEYLALDRWFQSSGISVRVENHGDLPMIYQAGEKCIFIQASLFRWSGKATEYLIQWIKDGGHLYLVLDYNTAPLNSYSSPEQAWFFREEEPFLLLENFGITVDTGYQGYRYDRDPGSGEAPDFYQDVFFQAAEDSGTLILNDRTGIARLVQVRHGEGTLTVSGRPRFLFSNYLGDAPNARLAWGIFSAADNEGWLFIRGTTKVQGLFGSLWQQGNLPVLIVSLIVLLVICFWAILPRFGLVKEDDERPGKDLRERFLAEGRFLKSYGALDTYRKTYLKEIKRRLARKEGLVDNDKIERRLLELCGTRPGISGGKSALLLKALRGDSISGTEFPKMVNVFKTILEKI